MKKIFTILILITVFAKLYSINLQDLIDKSKPGEVITIPEGNYKTAKIQDIRNKIALFQFHPGNSQYPGKPGN